MSENIEEELVTITRKEYLSMIDDGNWRMAFESAGVDNWSGWDMAMEDYREPAE